MSRYVSRPTPARSVQKAWDEGDFLIFDPMTMDVLEEEWDSEPTGLLDAEGYPIHRVRERVRCGFIPGDDE